MGAWDGMLLLWGRVGFGRGFEGERIKKVLLAGSVVYSQILGLVGTWLLLCSFLHVVSCWIGTNFALVVWRSCYGEYVNCWGLTRGAALGRERLIDSFILRCFAGWDNIRGILEREG